MRYLLYSSFRPVLFHYGFLVSLLLLPCFKLLHDLILLGILLSYHLFYMLLLSTIRRSWFIQLLNHPSPCDPGNRTSLFAGKPRHDTPNCICCTWMSNICFGTCHALFISLRSRPAFITIRPGFSNNSTRISSTSYAYLSSFEFVF